MHLMLYGIQTQTDPYVPYNVSVIAVNGAGRGKAASTIEFTAEGGIYTML